jgi:DNA-binding CsgD family transcriptional regulator
MDSDVLVRSAIHFGHGPGGSYVDPAAAWADKDGAAREDAAWAVHGLPFFVADSGTRMMIDDNRRVVWATSAAALLASGESCITITNGELAGRTRHSDALLREIFADAEVASPDAIEQLVASEPSRRPEVFVRAQSHSLHGAPCTLLTIRKLARELHEIPDLGRLYGLTRTEQQIVGMMVQGQSVTEIAQQLHKSVLTVRTHVKRMYSKLNVGTKEQLFSTVIKLMVD